MDRSFGFAQDKLGEGVLFSTLERGDRAHFGEAQAIGIGL